MTKISSPTLNGMQTGVPRESTNFTKVFSNFSIHKTWSIFLLYYAFTYIGFFSLLIYFTGFKYFGIGIAGIIGVQLLRVIPGVKQIVLKMNYYLLLWFYRINYVCTLTIYLGLCISPFIVAIYIANMYGGLLAALITLVVSMFTVFFVLYKRSTSDAKAHKAKVNVPSEPKKKKVAIVGAGVAGIVAAKECLAEGHDVVVYEYASKAGGVWNFDDSLSKRTTGRTLSSSSRYNSFFGDFPMNLEADQKTYSGSMYPSHYSEEDYRKYLKEYIDHFQIEKNIEFNTKVTCTERNENGKWVVGIENKNGEEREVIHDHVIVCTGLNHQIHGIKIAKDEKAQGIQMKHSASYNNNEEYRDKKVVIVGMGESSSDLAAEIAEVAKEVHVIVRNPVLLLPRNTFGQKIAPDHKLSRLILTCPQFMRTSKLISQTAMHGPINWIANKLLGLKDLFGTTLSDDKEYDDNWSWEWWTLFYKLGFFHPNAKWGLTRGQVTKTAPIVKAYRQGKLHFHTSSIKTSLNSLIVLEDGTRIEGVDALVNATGYKPVFPFLPEGYEMHETKDRYRMTFHPELPDMSFIGFCRGGVGSVMQAMEMQSRWVALTISEKRKLPSKEEMKTLVEKHKKQMIGKWPTKITMIYANAIAREEIGCEPNMWEIFKKSPRAWYYLMVGPYCMSMYRFKGPHATPELAVNVYQKGPELVWPLEFHLQHVFEFSIGVITRFWTSIPPFSYTRKSSLLSRYALTPFIDLEY